MNCWSGIGNVGADITLRTTASGRAVLNFRIAVDRVVKVETSEGPTFQKIPDWIPIVVFGDAAEHQAKYLQCGTKISVLGPLRPRTFTDKTGVTHYSFEVHAQEIDWLANVKSQRVAETTAEA